MSKATRYSPEVRARAVRMVFEHQAEYSSQWAALGLIAAKIGCTAETLRSWVRQAERNTGRRDGVTSAERDHVNALEREVRALRRANEILRKASAYTRRRSSTADPSDGEVHRRSPRCVRGRADRRGIADRPVDVLHAPGQSGGPMPGAAAHTA